jgi:hypothetical protein
LDTLRNYPLIGQNPDHPVGVVFSFKSPSKNVNNDQKEEGEEAYHGNVVLDVCALAQDVRKTPTSV